MDMVASVGDGSLVLTIVPCQPHYVFC